MRYPAGELDQRVVELHLVFFLVCQRSGLRNLMGRRRCSQLEVLDFALVEFQFRFPLGPQSLWMTKSC
jgi:hypothetical protein